MKALLIQHVESYYIARSDGRTKWEWQIIMYLIMTTPKKWSLGQTSPRHRARKLPPQLKARCTGTEHGACRNPISDNARKIVKEICAQIGFYSYHFRSYIKAHHKRSNILVFEVAKACSVLADHAGLSWGDSINVFPRKKSWVMSHESLFMICRP